MLSTSTSTDERAPTVCPERAMPTIRIRRDSNPLPFPRPSLFLLLFLATFIPSLSAVPAVKLGTLAARMRTRARAFGLQLPFHSGRPATAGCPRRLKVRGEEQGEKNIVPFDEGLSQIGEPTGPLACLLVGFNENQKEGFQNVMASLDADFVPVNVANQLDRTLLECLEAPFDEPINEKLLGEEQRIIFLSGMYPEEIQDVMSSYDEAGMPKALWAMAVPNSLKKNLRELVAEIMEDAKMMEAQEKSNST